MTYVIANDSNEWQNISNVFICCAGQTKGVFGSMDKYLREHYEDEITNLMNLPNNREHLSIHVE